VNLSPEQLTLVGLLLGLVTALVNGALVPGYIIKAAEKRHEKEMAHKDAEIQRWQNMALNLGGMAGQANRKAIAAIEEAKRLELARAQQEAGDDASSA
jgi:hypothetical protein